ncbi:protein of unknown function (plasmid) [Cupriavidus taiwanensis]|uniref:Uncharacterized protein n=1 Tax=Cupriavidus taiwanensis TaxID=164546 RepID=A0A375I6N8_9BURK|nr:hypothetical protein CT19425_U580017 [Cupriavidus taiwanensis]SPK77515.1 protein of unknown function [Cupriavidus taiwanensis]
MAKLAGIFGLLWFFVFQKTLYMVLWSYKIPIIASQDGDATPKRGDNSAAQTSASGWPCGHQRTFPL